MKQISKLALVLVLTALAAPAVAGNGIMLRSQLQDGSCLTDVADADGTPLATCQRLADGTCPYTGEPQLRRLSDDSGQGVLVRQRNASAGGGGYRGGRN